MKYFCTVLLSMLTLIVSANEVTIKQVKVECQVSCTFTVTLQHADQGWNHYANQWDVFTLDNQLLKSRVLYHPHVDEQPFTRSLSGVVIPEGVSRVKIRAKDTVHGYSSQEFMVDLR
jgi:hypothetical protein